MKNILLSLSFLLLVCLGYAQIRICPTDTKRENVVTILSFNDFHGAFIAAKDTPGAENFVSALLELKKCVPNPVILSGGDNFGGSYFSLMTNGEPHEVFTIPPSPDTLISAIGNHEFDWGAEYLMTKSTPHIQYVGANVSHKVRSRSFKDTIPDYRIIHRGSMRIGIIGLSTPTTPAGVKRPYVDNFEFEKKFASSVNEITRKLKTQQKVDIVILLMHIGTVMEDGVPAIDNMDKESEAELRKISGVDAIVSGHSHQLVRGMFAIADGEVPMIQAGANGSHIGFIQLEVRDNGVKFIKDSLIEVSVPHLEIKQTIDSISKVHGFNEIYVEATQTLIYDRKNDLHKFIEIGALVASSYLNEYAKSNSAVTQTPGAASETPVIAIHHFKGMRAGLSKGKLTRAQVGNVLPFGGRLVAYRMNGAQIKELFTIGLGNARAQGYLQTCNMQFKKDKEDKIISVKWLNKNGHYVEIADDRECTLLCDDFIAAGGDCYPTKLFSRKVDDFRGNTTTDSFINYLKQLKTIPTDDYRIAEVTDERPNK